MKFLETLAANPLSLFLVAVIVLSVGVSALCVGFAIHIAGPVSIQTPHIEVPGVEIHTGSAPATAMYGAQKRRTIDTKLLRRTQRKTKPAPQ
jgi:hypothetical protein